MLSDEQIVAVMRDGYNCRYNDEQDHIDFARTIEAEVSKQDTELIRQMLEAMEPVSEFGRVGSRDIEQAALQAAITAARARLENT